MCDRQFFVCHALSHTFFSLHSRPTAALVTPPPMSVCSDTKKSGEDTLLSPLFFYWFSRSVSPVKYGKKTLHLRNGYRNDSLMVSKFIPSRAEGLAVDGSGMRSEMRSAIMSVIRMSSWLSRPSMLPYEPSSLCS